MLSCAFKFNRLVNDYLRERNVDVVLIKEKFELTVEVSFYLITRSFFAPCGKANDDGRVTEFGNALVERTFFDVGDRRFDRREIFLLRSLLPVRAIRRTQCRYRRPQATVDSSC